MARTRLQVAVRDYGGARGNEYRCARIYKDGELVGCCASGGYGWRVQKSHALGMVSPGPAAAGTELDVQILGELLGELYKATVIAESPCDPGNAALRS